MTLTPEIETRGLRAYEQARAFERIRSWRLPLGYALLVLTPVIIGAALLSLGYVTLGALNFLGAGFLTWSLVLHWKRLVVRYGENVLLLADLEKTYGDALPWVQVEHHFAALEQLKRELSEENTP